jgi:uncharacterized membrane protein
MNAVGMAFGMTMVLALPIQAMIEVAWWLRFAEWPRFDLIFLSHIVPSIGAPTTGFVGLDQVIDWLWDAWLSVPIALVSGLIFFALVGILRDANKWAQEGRK